MEEKEKEKEKLLEVSIGLALQILKFRDLEGGHEIERAGIREEDFVRKLVEILRRYENPESKVPRMRRFVIELAITLMNYELKYVELFRVLGMEQVLIRSAETTSELECFNVFSGSVGLGRHEVMISSLVDTALELLDRDSDSSWEN